MHLTGEAYYSNPDVRKQCIYAVRGDVRREKHVAWCTAETSGPSVTTHKPRLAARRGSWCSSFPSFATRSLSSAVQRTQQGFILCMHVSFHAHMLPIRPLAHGFVADYPRIAGNWTREPDEKNKANHDSTKAPLKSFSPCACVRIISSRKRFEAHLSHACSTIIYIY